MISPDIIYDFKGGLKTIAFQYKIQYGFLFQILRIRKSLNFYLKL